MFCYLEENIQLDPLSAIFSLCSQNGVEHVVHKMNPSPIWFQELVNFTDLKKKTNKESLKNHHELRNITHFIIVILG